MDTSRTPFRSAVSFAGRRILPPVLELHAPDDLARSRAEALHVQRRIARLYRPNDGTASVTATVHTQRPRRDLGRTLPVASYAASLSATRQRQSATEAQHVAPIRDDASAAASAARDAANAAAEPSAPLLPIDPAVAHRLFAIVRGFIVRQLMRSSRIRNLSQTIRVRASPAFQWAHRSRWPC